MKYTITEIAIGKLEYGSGASSVPFDGTTRYIRITDIDENGRLNNDCVSPSVVEESAILNDGDILFARTGATVGKTYRYCASDGRCQYAGYLIRVVPNQQIIRPDYLWLYTQSSRYWNFINSSMKIVAQPNINAKQYGGLVIDVPTLKEQDRIIQKLFAIRSLIVQQKRQLEQLDLLIKARFVELFGECKEKRRLSEYAELITKGASPRWQGVEYNDNEEGTLFITSENVREGYIDYSKKKYLPNAINEILPRSILKRNDVLVNIVNASIGRAAIYESDDLANINQAVALVRLKPGVLNVRFLLTFLNSDEAIKAYNRMKVGGDKANLSLKNISDLMVPDVSLELQSQFAEFVEQVDKSKFVVQKSLKETHLLFDSLMQQYFG